MNIVVINYGMGNLGSVRRAFEDCGATVCLSDDPAGLARAERIVLPGVGAFSTAMANLNAAGWPAALREVLRNPEVRLLGICLGMQLLADKSYEFTETAGLGLIGGEVKRLEPQHDERIPHMGWNEVRISQPSSLFRGIEDCTDFYFVHSYCFHPSQEEAVLARTPYCGEFVSVVGRANILGVQFHPEKSSRAGLRLIQNFLDGMPC